MRGVGAVIKTDILQFFIFMIILPIITISLLKENSGNIQSLIHQIPTKNIIKNISIPSVLALALLSLLPDANPSFIQRMLIGKDTKKNRVALNSMALVSVLIILMVLIIGGVALIKYPDIHSNEAIFIVIQKFLNNEVCYAFFGVALIALIVSTADSLINTATVIVVNDVINKKIRDNKKILLARGICLLTGILAVLIALKINIILKLVLFFGQFYSSAIFVPYIFGLFIKRKTPIMFWSSSILGVGSYLLIYLIFPKLEYSIFLISMLISTVCYMVFSQKKYVNILNKLRNIPIRFNFNENYNRLPFIKLGYSILPVTLSILLSDYSKEQLYLIEISVIIVNIFLALSDIIFKEGTKLKYVFSLVAFWYCFPFFSMYLYFFQNTSILLVFHFSATIALLVVFYRWEKVIINLLIAYIIVCMLFFFQNKADFNLLISNTTPLILMLLYICVMSFVFFRKRDQHEISQLENIKMLGGVIAHEMRTPFATIRANLGILNKKLKLDKDNVEIINRIMLTVDRANTNIDVLLNNIKTNIDLKNESVRINDVINEAILEYPLLENERRYLNVVYSEENQFINIDRLYCKYAIFNIFKNAFFQRKKHNRGEIKIIGNDKSIIIEDNIIGIKNEEIDKIYYNFFTNEQEGTGLGLPFAKLVVNKMGGEIICQSEYLQYTRFILKFL
jgi:signal transduction histidine kinase